MKKSFRKVPVQSGDNFRSHWGLCLANGLIGLVFNGKGQGSLNGILVQTWCKKEEGGLYETVIYLSLGGFGAGWTGL